MKHVRDEPGCRCYRADAEIWYAFGVLQRAREAVGCVIMAMPWNC
jgi:hypothetical protein